MKISWAEVSAELEIFMAEVTVGTSIMVSQDLVWKKSATDCDIGQNEVNSEKWLCFDDLRELE